MQMTVFCWLAKWKKIQQFNFPQRVSGVNIPAFYFCSFISFQKQSLLSSKLAQHTSLVILTQKFL